MNRPNIFLTDEEFYLFGKGSYCRAYNKFGAHFVNIDGADGVLFTVWAPDTRSVRVVGSFNFWNVEALFMDHIRDGVYSLFVPGLSAGVQYKYAIEAYDGRIIYKADPFAFSSQLRPDTASVTASLGGFKWTDGRWLGRRRRTDHRKKPLNIYEVHAGSWKRPQDKEFYTYAELADLLVPYVKDMGYTHIELLPIAEYPFDGSWGYQITGFFAPTSRYGTPQELMYLVNKCHEAGIGVILDWVPGHFCRDAHGLGRFNGQPLYEAGDHQQWGTYKFDFSRPQVRSFLLSNVMYWLDVYHIDGIRVDGVSSMLYLNFGADNRQKLLNEFGGEENLDAISFLREFNALIGQFYPGVFTAAEESSAWPLVTYPPSDGGLGFNYKWNMGWMNDTLKYISIDFEGRKYNHNLLTFSMMYAFSENFILPFSHDEVVHGKKSLIGRCPGDYRQQFAGARLLRLLQMCHPGAKLSFMGNEFSQFVEWRYYESLEWFLLGYDTHRANSLFTKCLNKLFLSEKALYGDNFSWGGFEWIDVNNNEQSVLSFARKCGSSTLIAVLNFGCSSYKDYRVGVPVYGVYQELINSDNKNFGGSDHINTGDIVAEKIPMHGKDFSVRLNIPPVGGTVLKLKRRRSTGKKAAAAPNGEKHVQK